MASYTMQWQIVLCLLLLPLTGRAARNREFIANIGVALLMTIVLFGIFPAAGAWVHFGVRDPAELGYLQQLIALRQGHMAVLRLDALDGLITFPSFHVVTAVVVSYAARGTPLAVLTIMLNLTMAVAALSEGLGGHYLMDAIGGVLVALAAIVVVRRTYRFATTPHPACSAERAPSAVG